MKSNNRIVAQGNTLPDEDNLNAIGDEILSPQGRICIKYTLKPSRKEPERNIFYLARHNNVMDILKGQYKDKVDLSQFDEGLATGVGDERFFLGADSSEKAQQWDILKAALNESPKLSRTTSAESFKNIADDAVSTALTDIRTRHERLGWRGRIRAMFGRPQNTVQFNAAKEYGYVVPFLVMAQFIGLQMPKSTSWQLNLLTAVRNMMRPGTIRVESEPMRSALQMLMWVHFIFGHLFANIGNRNKGLTIMALWASRRFRHQIDFSFNLEKIPYGSLLHRLRTVKKSQFSSMPDAEYLRHVRGIVLEVAGAGQILTGTSFANILGVLHDKNRSVDEFVDLIKLGNNDIIDEALRLDTTTKMVFRVAKDYIKIGDETIAPNDIICLLINRACLDEKAFPQAQVFSDFSSSAPQRDRLNYLTFGPHEGMNSNVFQPSNNTHPCFGQYWARTILISMFEGLQKLPSLGYKNSAKPIFKDFLGIPDTALLVYEQPKPEAPQTLVTICSEITIPLGNTEQEATVQKLLDDLGNPVKPELMDELQKIKTLHFISIHVIKGVGKEPDYLMLEMSMDGTENKAIDDILSNDKFKQKLEAIYKAAGCIKKDTDLRRHLADHSVELKQSLWPKFFSGRWINGLGFSGTTGLTLKRIKAEQKIAEYASLRLSNVSKKSIIVTRFDGPAHKMLKIIRQKILTDPELADSRWVLHDSKPPVFAETRDSVWKKTWGKVEEITNLFPHAFLFLLAAIGVVLWSAIWGVLFAGELNLEQLCNRVAEGKCKIENTLVFPPDITTLFSRPKASNGAQEVYIYLSAMPLILNCIVALFIALFVTMVFPRKRNTSALRQTGLMFWFVGGFMFLQFQTVYHNLSNWALSQVGAEDIALSRWFGFNARVFDWVPESALVIFQFFLILGLIFMAALFIFKTTIGKTGINRGFAPYLILFMMVILFGTVAIQQYILFGVPYAGTNNGIALPSNFLALNKFETAKLSVLLMYPMLTSLVLTGVIYAYNMSFPDYKIYLVNSKKRYILCGLIFFLSIFYTSFFTAPESFEVFFKQTVTAASMLVFIPLLISFLICSLVFLLSSTLIGKKQNKTLYTHILWWFFGISAALNLTSRPRGKLTDVMSSWLKYDASGQVLLEKFREKMAEILFALGVTLPVLLIIGGVVGILLWKILAKSEASNKPHDSDAMISNIEKMMLNENHPEYVQNHMISVTRLIPEHFRRRITLPLALSIMVSAAKKKRARPGFLGTIGTVHFARWLHLPRTNNYVFASNYDGSFESYLEDFITKFGEPLNGAWSHGVGYPKTKGVFFDGSVDGERFIRWARGSMRPTPFWYSAYPKLSVEQIRRNALIRDGLARIENPSDAEAWLDLFDSVTRPDHALQTEQIQSLVFGGAKKLNFGCCLVVEMDKDNQEKFDENKFSNWINNIRGDITFGDLAPGDKISYLALSKDGLQSAGFADDLSPDRRWKGSEELVGDQEPIKFSSAFALGMNNKSRASLLGDIGDNDPETWGWGTQQKPALAVLLLYAKTKPGLAQLVKRHNKALSENGMLAQKIDFTSPTAPEPFGFKDGISNPILKGTIRGARNSQSIHLVNPGEIVLGYKDNRGYFPSSPQIESVRDRDQILPAIPRSQPQKYPEFQGNASDTLRDLGRNGSYLVIRQLEQDKSAFEDATKIIAEDLYPDEFEAEDINRINNAVLAAKAKLMGRWQDGRPLVTAPVKLVPLPNGNRRLLKTEPYPEGTNLEEAERRDNEFLFGRDDPQGHACPFGSHIRRTFPRDSLNPGEDSELEISNRHRLLRRGRSYKIGDKDQMKEGTFFMCLNANIERQFEFVQQTWVGGSTFHGLRNEVDPITAQRDGNPQSFTFQAPGRDNKTSSLQSFVRMRGGGYFFMPGRDALEFIAKYKADL